MSIVKVLMDGKTFEMEVDKDTTILEKAMDEDIDIPFSCQSGVCTSCIGKLVEGDVEMEVNDGLSDEELKDGYVLCCQSFPRSEKIIIEID